jgi:hypothetical protein
MRILLSSTRWQRDAKRKRCTPSSLGVEKACHHSQLLLHISLHALGPRTRCPSPSEHPCVRKRLTRMWTHAAAAIQPGRRAYQLNWRIANTAVSYDMRRASQMRFRSPSYLLFTSAKVKISTPYKRVPHFKHKGMI